MARHRIERALRTHVEVSRALFESVGEADLLDRVCRVAVQVAGYRLAWVGYAEGDGAVRPVAQFGFDAGYLESARISWVEDERGQGPTGSAIRTGEPQLCQHLATDPRLAQWREDALRRGYAASLSLPLRDGGVTFGALSLYAAEPNAFDAEEIELLTLMANDLAFGILAARGRTTLAQLQRRLELVNRLDLVGRTSAAIAHDVNNALTVVMFCLGEIRSGRADDRVLADADAALDRAARLNRRLLEAVNPPNDARDLAPDEVLGGQVPSIVRAFDRRIQVRLELGAPDACVHMSPVALEQVISNLLVNARNAMPDGGTVTVGTATLDLRHPLDALHVGLAPGPYLEIAVTDTGVGIAPQDMERIFEPFFTTDRERGAGLGLTTAAGAVRRAGGQISATSHLGEGTTFFVYLPLIPGGERPQPAAS